MTVLQEGSNLGPYRIISQIGIGGMATVYKAYQPSMDRFVAIKVLPPYHSDDPQFIDRFIHEARTIANLEHQNILPVYDFGEDESISYLVMRFLEGGTLKQIMDHGRMALPDISEIFRQICAGLDYAHRQGVVHRDVKPANIIIDKEGAVYLTDFGIAKVLENSPHLTATGTSIGTPTYMSPEQSLAKDIDARSDIYSLGVILYEMVVGKVPYEADTPMAVALAHIHEPLPLPRSIDPTISEAIERCIIKALAKDPDDRYQTASEMYSSLSNAIELLDSTREVAGEETLSVLITRSFESPTEALLPEEGVPTGKEAPRSGTPPRLKPLPDTIQDDELVLPTIREEPPSTPVPVEALQGPTRRKFPLAAVVVGIGGIFVILVVIALVATGSIGSRPLMIEPTPTTSSTMPPTPSHTPIPPTITPTPLHTSESGLTVYDDFNVVDGRIDTDRWDDDQAGFQIEDGVLIKRASKGDEPHPETRFASTDMRWNPRTSGEERLAIESKILMRPVVEQAGMNVGGLLYLQGPDGHYFAIGSQWDHERGILHSECHGGDPDWNRAFHRIGNRINIDSWYTFRYNINENPANGGYIVVGTVDGEQLCKFPLSETWQQTIDVGGQLGLTVGVWWDEAWAVDEELEIWFDDVAGEP